MTTTTVGQGPPTDPAAESHPSRAAVQAAASFQRGDTLRDGRYEIYRLVRRASGKAVYLAHDRKFDCPVALDVFSNNAILPSGLTVSAWETLVLGRLGDHPNIGTVLDHWEEGDAAFMVSRYLGGGTLRDLIARSEASGEQLSVTQVLDLAVQISLGLEHIHSRRILYRDLQPQNVLFDEWGTIHLVDFDSAMLRDDGEMSDISQRETIEYMAPELTRACASDERGDLYSLGATIYEMCCGRPPCTGTRQQIVDLRASLQPPAIERNDVPNGLRDLVASLLAPDPGQRPSSAREVAARLQELRNRRADLERFLTSAETATLEFKASLRTPLDPPRANDSKSEKERKRSLEHEVIETIAGLLNTYGGTLLIGVKDDRSIVGIEVDFPNVSGSTDGWCRTFDNLISRDLGVEALGCIELELEPWEGQTVAVVRCARRGGPTWIQNDLFVRRTASTEKLSAKHAVAWCREHWAS